MKIDRSGSFTWDTPERPVLNELAKIHFIYLLIYLFILALTCQLKEENLLL